MTALPSIDKVLRSATEAGYLPGVVAAAATREGPIYQGAEAGAAGRPGHDGRFSILDCVDDEGGNIDRCDAAC